ncbi:MAG: glycosyltransferase, partial [Nitrospiraceae bacterium]
CVIESSLTVFRDSEYLRRMKLPCPVRVANIGKLRSLDALAKLWRLSRAIRRAGVAIVHVFFPDASIVAPIFCKLGGARVIMSKRDMGFWHTTLQRWALRVSNLFADRIVANSQAVRDHVVRREWVPVRKLSVVPNGYDENRFMASSSVNVRKVLGIAEDEPIVGMVANLHPWKNHAHLLRAFALVLKEHPSAHLVLAGEGEQKGLLRDLARTLGIADRAHFLGFVQDPIPVIQECAVCVLCSESEGLSNAVMEYMGCGKPAICTNVGGNRELIEDGRNGFLVDVGDVHGLAERIRRILSDPELGRVMGKHAQRRISDNYSLERMADSYSRLYEELAEEGQA